MSDNFSNENQMKDLNDNILEEIRKFKKQITFDIWILRILLCFTLIGFIIALLLLLFKKGV